MFSLPLSDPAISTALQYDKQMIERLRLYSKSVYNDPKPIIMNENTINPYTNELKYMNSVVKTSKVKLQMSYHIALKHVSKKNQSKWLFNLVKCAERYMRKIIQYSYLQHIVHECICKH